MSSHETPTLEDAGELAIEKPQVELKEKVLIEDSKLASAIKDAYAEVVRKGEDGSLIIRGTKDDPASPRNWKTWKRCAYYLSSCFVSS